MNQFATTSLGFSSTPIHTILVLSYIVNLNILNDAYGATENMITRQKPQGGEMLISFENKSEQGNLMSTLKGQLHYPQERARCPLGPEGRETAVTR